ncbi:MAG: hypothetical protein IJP90_10170 [Treponema sp.]|nr:hypothetical protein [Treponema sp.]MBR0100062.1 hypothetical protein [Treponema sp.]
MKKYIQKAKFLPLLCLAPLFYSCGSVPTDLKSYSPVAIVTVYSNPSVPWYDEKSGGESVEDGILSGTVNRMINKKNPETEKEAAQSRIDYASELLSQRMKDFGLEVVDPDEHKDCVVYKDTESTFYDYLKNTVPAKGYNAITNSNGKINRLVCKETGAQSVLYVNFRFQKVMLKDGVRNKGVAARLVMSVFGTDSNGKKIINKEYNAVSSDYTDLIKSSDWDKEKLVSFFPELENQLIINFLTDFTNNAESPALSDLKPTAIKIKSTQKDSETKSGSSENTIQDDAVLAEKKATAKKLLERGMSAQEAAEITGLTAEEVENLKK